MKYQVPGKCCICGGEITITHFTCKQCGTKTEGEFTPCKFCKLDKDQLELVEAFLRCRGNIRDVEKELGLSYPTIRNRLDEVLLALGIHRAQEESGEAKERKDYSKVLEALERGELTAQEALMALKGKK